MLKLSHNYNSVGNNYRLKANYRFKAGAVKAGDKTTIYSRVVI